MENHMVVGAADEYERLFPEATPEYNFEREWAATEDAQTIEYWRMHGLPKKLAYGIAELMKEVENRRTGDKLAEGAIVDCAVLLMGDAVQDIMENE